MLHTTLGGGTIQGVHQTLLTRGLSYNYIIKNGIVYEIVPYYQCAWHAGVIKNPNMRSQVFYKTLKGEDNPNRQSVGIAFDYPQGATQLSDADINAAIDLIKWIGSETGYRYNADNIFYHKEVTSNKPIAVKGYRDQVLDALVGDKDDKDAGEISRKRLLIKYLTLQVKLLTLQLFARQNAL